MLSSTHWQRVTLKTVAEGSVPLSPPAGYDYTPPKSRATDQESFDAEDALHRTAASQVDAGVEHPDALQHAVPSHPSAVGPSCAGKVDCALGARSGPRDGHIEAPAIGACHRAKCAARVALAPSPRVDAHHLSAPLPHHQPCRGISVREWKIPRLESSKGSEKGNVTRRNHGDDVCIRHIRLMYTTYG